MFRLVLIGWISIAIAQTTWAQTLTDPPPEDTSILSSSALSTALESVADLSFQVDDQHTMNFVLQDGTHIGGLLFTDPSKGVRPLIVADYGLLSSRDSGLGGEYVESIFNNGQLNANLLIVDDVSGADFYASNQSLSMGGYDAGRILVELASQLKSQGIAQGPITLLGESLGGLAVLEALLEDQRLGTNLFQSAITFSSVINEAKSTASVISAFGYPLNGLSGPPMTLEGEAFLFASMLSFNTDVPPSSGLPTLSFSTAGSYFYNEFNRRLQSLSVSNWNPAVDRSSVENYLQTSSALLNQIAEVSAPMIVVHAQNDPVVSYSQFVSFAQAQSQNSKIYTLGTEDGSHCGFFGAYGAKWVASLVNRALSL